MRACTRGVRKEGAAGAGRGRGGSHARHPCPYRPSPKLQPQPPHVHHMRQSMPRFPYFLLNSSSDSIGASDTGPTGARPAVSVCGVRRWPGMAH